MAPGQGRSCVVADLLVELLVLLVADVFFRARPQGAGLVHGFPHARFHHAAGLAFFSCFLPLFLLDLYRQADVVGVFVDDGFELPVVGKLQRVFAQVQGDAGAAVGFVDGLDFKVTTAAADPTHALVCRQTCAARFDGDFVSDDKARIKAHAKLADELALVLGVTFLRLAQATHKVFGAAFGDRAQVVDGFLGAHADAVIADGDGFGIVAHAHFQFAVALVQRVVVQRFKAQLVASV